MPYGASKKRQYKARKSNNTKPSNMIIRSKQNVAIQSQEKVTVQNK